MITLIIGHIPVGTLETMCMRLLGGIFAFEGHEAMADPVPTQCVSCCHLALELSAAWLIQRFLPERNN